MSAVKTRFRTLLEEGALAEFRDRLANRSVRLAVTGLSNSGKTVFITALIQQLMHSGQSLNLPFFRVLAEGRLLGTRLASPRSLRIPRFPYEEALGCLGGDAPRWPSSTRGLSAVDIEIHFRPRGLRSWMSEHAVLHVEVIDYPGEWLLDLPLLQMSFEEWSVQMLRLCEEEPRKQLSAEWRALLQTVDFAAETDESLLQQLTQAYTAYLHQCRKPEYGLSLIQPGRFVLPGELEGAPLLQFCPVPAPREVSGLAEKSLYRTMQRHFEAYKKEVVREFYRDYFSSFDRQVVLVDVLQALNHGPTSYADMRHALNTILASFSYGKSNLITRLFSPRIDRLLFAATKADHVTPDQWHNHRQFLHRLIAQTENAVRCEQVETEVLGLAALRSTRTGKAMVAGEELPCLVGSGKTDDKLRKVFPGEIPEQVPQPQNWTEDRFHFVDFAPPRVGDVNAGPLPHINMDKALEFLLGDKF